MKTATKQCVLSLFALSLLGSIGCRMAPLQVIPQPREVVGAPDEIPQIPPPDARAAEVPEGYKVDIVASGLTYPSSVEFDDQGNLYIAEAGYAYGDEAAPARVLRLQPDGQTALVADQLNGPITDLLWHDGRLYISHRGKISILTNNTVLDIVTGLPSLGDHHNNQLAVGPDGKIYLGQGTASNSGVVGVDNYAFGWLGKHAEFHDLPPFDIKLAGRKFASLNPLKLTSEKEALLARTGAFQPFGNANQKEIEGTVKGNGTILRFNPDGSDVEVFAWGLRNPFGVMWGPDKQLYVADNGFDERGSRPIANAPDVIWRVEKGFWYGWPDYAGGVPVTDRQFKPEKGPQPEFLMENHPSASQPLVRLAHHAGVTKIDFSRGASFGFEGEMFVGEVGDAQPITGNDARPVGHQVIRLNPSTGEMEPFFGTRSDQLGPRYLEYVTTTGPKGIIDVKFSPQGDALYVADFGAMMILPTPYPTPHPFPGSGVIWRITREGTTPAFAGRHAFQPAQVLELVTPTGRTEPKAPTPAEAILDGWKMRPAEVARQMIAKYGPPQEVTTHRLVWHNNRPWKRTEIVNEEVTHHFPKLHLDVLTQTINLRIPANKIDDLAQLDGSIIADRTRGELSVRGDGEPMNLLMANLAHEVLIGARSIRDARQMFTETVRELKHSSYTARLLFAPSSLPQGDPGQAIALP